MRLAYDSLPRGTGGSMLGQDVHVRHQYDHLNLAFHSEPSKLDFMKVASKIC